MENLPKVTYNNNSEMFVHKHKEIIKYVKNRLLFKKN